MSIKKIEVLILFVLLFLNLIYLVYAENLPGMPSEVEKINEGIENTQNKIQGIESGNYNIKQPLIDKAETSGIKGIIFAISDFFSVFNPFFNIVLGVEYSFSIAFVFSIAIWLILFLIIGPIMIVVLGNKTFFGYVAGFCIASLIGLSGVIRKAVDLISLAIKTPKLAIICLIIAIAIVMLLGIFRNMFRKGKKEDAKEQEARDRETLHTAAEVAKKQIKLD